MYNPVTTYRIQFNKDYPLKEFKNHIVYLHQLGIVTIYASPILAATPGSGHGYDVVNPTIFNPEITSQNEFLSFCARMKELGIDWLQDIVPNHMAYHPDNVWLMDLLEKGPQSAFIDYFDLEPGVLSDGVKIMVPFLGVSLEDALNNNEITIGFRKGNFTINYYDNIYPVSPQSFGKIISSLSQKDKLSQPDLKELLAESEYLNMKNWDATKKKLEEYYNQDKSIKNIIDNLAKEFSESEKLRELLEEQHYELCHWQETEKRINYRRFFTVNSLICLKMENEKVFDSYHIFISELLREGCFRGLRIDHIDGLNNPNAYLTKLRKLTGKDIYIVAEKILEPGEELPPFWPIQGSTGYDFLAQVNNLLTSTRNYDKLRSLYKDITHQTTPAEELIYQNKRMMLTTRMHGEWDNIVNYFNRLDFLPLENISEEEIKEAIGEFMLACPVYRLYPNHFPVDDHNRRIIEDIFARALARNPGLKNAMDVLNDIILNNNQDDEPFNKKVYDFFTRMMQYTGPLMAKGVEDTSMYQYNCFITHNEVGDAINASGVTIDEFHQLMQQRQLNWPLAMNTTSTHDTKRGEDVRARLNVLSELTDEWEDNVKLWMQMNQKLKIRLDTGLLEPSLTVEYFIYQTLMGTFPADGSCDETYLQRIDEYLVKALRESKRKVSWRNPDETYENTVCSFARNMLDPSHEFLQAFLPFQQKIAWYGSINSLTQLTLKCCCPGIPDIYQGTELWDLTLVDPDNRQPVDYKLRSEILNAISGRYSRQDEELIPSLMQDYKNGQIKLLFTWLLLNLRRENPLLFQQGEYIPLKIRGRFEGRAMAFARRHNQQFLIVVVPLFVSSLLDIATKDSKVVFDWQDTYIQMESSFPSRWKSLLTLKEHEWQGKININDIMEQVTPSLLISLK